MCGIYFSLGHRSFLAPDDPIKLLLHSRGPDSAQQYDVEINLARANIESKAAASSVTQFATFYSTVLSLRGDHTVAQPLVDDRSGSVLCWNGEAWETGYTRINGNDSVAVFELLLQASASSIGIPKETTEQPFIHALKLVKGPFAFVFYDRPRAVIYFGRDRLGRRSLLRRTDEFGNLYLSSVCTGISEDAWEEVEANGLYMIDLRQTILKQEAQISGEVSRLESTSLQFQVRHLPYRYRGATQTLHPSIELPWPPLNNILPTVPHQHLNLHSPSLQHLENLLCASLYLRLSNIPSIHPGDSTSEPFYPARLAILFSGGLDCTLLARISNDILSPSEPIDLLNVAFENPRIHNRPSDTQSDNPYESCPDRITARASLLELQRQCPERTWRLVEINIPYAQTRQHRKTIVKLIHPHDTEMDLSIACALYFAARGSGVICTSRNPSTLSSDIGSTYAKSETVRYTTSARVLLSGLGADELFAGYQRHAIAFARQSFPGLISELALDFERLGKRNLGRDDRVTSHWEREVRYPYLDEKVVTWALERPVWEKCGFGDDGAGEVARVSATGNGDAEPQPLLEPGKKILRLLAWKLGMVDVAKEKKRAIQFGARTAKMEIGRTKGTQKIS